MPDRMVHEGGPLGFARRCEVGKVGKRWLVCLVMGWMLVWAATTDAAQREVSLPYGPLSLAGTLELASGKTLSDGVVLMLHGALAHKDMQVMRDFRSMFSRNGYNTLAINLSLGVDGRDGMFDCETPSLHKAEDALDELDAWLDWLAAQGAGPVVILGFSRGGHQVAWFAAERSRPQVSSYILLAPAIPSDAEDPARYEARHGARLEPVLEQARRMVDSGREADFLEEVAFMHCGETRVSAESFLSYYAPDPEADTLPLLRRIRTPTLLLVAGLDEIVIDADRRLGVAADGDFVEMKVIPGADHFFHDLFGEDAMDEVVEFLGR